jgi:hypothetical protein
VPYCDGLSDEKILSALPVLPGIQFRSHVVSQGLEQKLSLLQVYRSQPMEKFARAARNYWNRRGGERLWIANNMT